MTCTKRTKNAFGRYMLHHSTPFHSFLGNLETSVRMRKDTYLNTHPGPPTAGSVPGENLFRGLQQGWTGMGKNKETKRTASYARRLLAESTVNTTKSLRHYIWYCCERQTHTQHSRDPRLGNLYRPPPSPSTAQYTPMKTAERYPRTRLPSTCDI